MRTVDPRTKTRSVRFTAREDAALERAARKARKTVAAFIRDTIAAARLADREEPCK